MRASAVRACLMALLYLAAPLIGRRPNALMALAGTALIVHALQPWLIFDIGCVLSFTVMVDWWPSVGPSVRRGSDCSVSRV